MRLREQMGNLGFEGARVDDLSERRVGRERQKIARNIEGAARNVRSYASGFISTDVE